VLEAALRPLPPHRHASAPRGSRQTDVKPVTTRGDAAASCFDWREATSEPTADDLTAALCKVEARHPSRAALAFSIFSVNDAPAQNAVRPTALTED